MNIIKNGKIWIQLERYPFEYFNVGLTYIHRFKHLELCFGFFQITIIFGILHKGDSK